MQPFWSADSRRVLFIDKPNAGAPTGIYAVGVDAPRAPQLVTMRIANYTGDMQYAIYFEGVFTVVERVGDGAKWKIRTGARNVALSPDRTRVVWNDTPETFPIENRVANVMLYSLPRQTEEGQGEGEPRKLTTVLRGGASGWLDNQHLLMTGRLNRASNETTLSVLSLADGSRRELAKAERLRSVVPSRDGSWIAYTLVFEKDAAQSGLWVVSRDGGTPKKLDFFGAFQWRDGRRLIYVPLQARAASHVFYEYDVVSGATRQLTDPATLAFKIANGDWAVSPDGTEIVLVNAQDQNLWLVKLK